MSVYLRVAAPGPSLRIFVPDRLISNVVRIINVRLPPEVGPVSRRHSALLKEGSPIADIALGPQICSAASREVHL